MEEARFEYCGFALSCLDNIGPIEVMEFFHCIDWFDWHENECAQ